MGSVVALRTGSQRAPVLQPEQLVSKPQAARLLGVTPQTLDRWVRDGMPRDVPGEQWGCWFYVGKRRRYYPNRIREYWHR